MMKKKNLLISLTLGIFCFSTASSAQDLRNSSYAAHLAAAGNALELHRAGEARGWLADAPEELRSWEWHWLDARSSEHLDLLQVGAPVTALAASADGTRLASGDEDGVIHLWELPTQRLMYRLEAHAGAVHGLAFDTGGRRLASTGADRAIRVWNPEGERSSELIADDVESFTKLAWAPEADELAVGGWARDPQTRRPKGFFLLFNPDKPALIDRTSFSYSVGAVAFSADGRFFAIGTPDGQVGVADRRGGGAPRILKIESETGFPYVEELAFTADGETLFATVQDGTVRSWTTSSWEVGETLAPAVEGPLKSLHSAAFPPDAAWIATGSSDGLIRVYNGPDRHLLYGHVDGVTGLAQARGDLWSSSDDGTVRRWAPAAQGTVFEHDEVSIWGAAFSGNGRYIATALDDGKVSLWSIADQRLLRSFTEHEGDAVRVAFLEDDTRIISTGNDGKIVLHETATGKLLRTVEEIENGRSAALAVSPDGKFLAAGSARGTAKVWDTQTWEAIHEVGGHDGEIQRLVWSPDGERLITSGSDGLLQVFRLGEEIEKDLAFRAHEASVHAVTISPDGKRLATASQDRTVRIWDASTGTRLHELRGHEERVWDVRWSPDGRRLVSASNDSTVRLWDPESGLQVLRIGTSMQAYIALWSPDGTALAIASMDGKLRLERVSGSTDISR